MEAPVVAAVLGVRQAIWTEELGSRIHYAWSGELHGRWCSDYDAKARAFNACRYLKTVGSDNRLDRIEQVVRFHDSETRALAPGTLA